MSGPATPTTATVHHLQAPLTDADLLHLRAGDLVTFNGYLYGARDAAHARLVATLEAGEHLPIDLAGQVIYYVGPTPAADGRPIGSAGPTTSGRMDRYTPALLHTGVRALIGKGYRSPAVRAALVAHRAIYLAATGGAGAMLGSAITAAEVVAYADLGPEAIYRFSVDAFPAIVVNDCAGNDLYQQARETWRVPMPTERTASPDASDQRG